MQSGITARDKKLLYMLGIIVIVSLFYIIGIRPINRKINKLDEKVDDAKVEYDTMKMKLYQLDMIKDFKDNSEKKAAELSSRYYEKMVSAEVDKIITNKALGYGLKVNNLRIKMGKDPAFVSAYINSAAYAAFVKAQAESQELSDADTASSDSDSDSSNDSDNSSSAEGMVDINVLASINQDFGIYSVADTTPADVYATGVELDVYGSREKAQALLDELIGNKALRVTSYEWSEMNGLPYEYVDGQLVELDKEISNRLIIKFDMYMYDGTEFKAMAEKEGE